MPLVWIVAGVLGLVGGVFLALGMRGRRINDHPICRKCRFDLIGLYEPGQQVEGSRCPECGQEFGSPAATGGETPRSAGRQQIAVRFGARRRGRGALALGAVCVVFSLSIVGALGWGAANTFNWNTIKPVWWLVLESKSADAAVAQPVLVELASRAAKGRLKRTTHRRLVDRALMIQADENATWIAEWGDLVEIASGQDWLSEEDIHQYVLSAMDVSIGVRSPVMLGVESTIRVSGMSSRAGTGGYRNFEIIIDVQDIFFDSEKIEGVKRHAGIGFGLGSGSFGIGSKFNPDAPGEHEVKATLRFYVKKIPRVSGGGSYVWVRADSYAPSESDLGPWMAQRTATLTVLPAGQSDVTLTEAPELAEEIRKSVHIRNATLTHKPESDTVYFNIMIERPPVNVAFHVFLRSGDTEIPVGYSWGVAGASFGSSGEGSADRIDLKHAQLVFRADEEAVRRSGVLHEAWAGEIVIADITFEEIDERQR